MGNAFEPEIDAVPTSSGVPAVAAAVRRDPEWTPREGAIYLATLAPFVLIFVGAALGWTIAPLEHLRPTPGNIIAGAVTLAVGLLIVRARWGTRHSPRASTIVPEFEPPEGLRPAEVDVLVQGLSHRRDVTATIVDLAQRGFVRIDERPTPHGPQTWVFERAERTTRDLREYERLTLAGLFAHGPTVTLAELDPRYFVTADLVQEALDLDVVRRGWFAEAPARLRSRWATAGWVTALAGIPVTFILGNTLALGLAGAAVSAIGVFVYAAAPWRPARTGSGAALALRAAGFELFLRTAEAERHRFAERERVFEDYLPYVIALGFVEQWGRAFGLVDRPGDFDAPAPALIPLQARLVGLVRQLEAAKAPSATKGPPNRIH